jgi:hypothetical protein
VAFFFGFLALQKRSFASLRPFASHDFTYECGDHCDKVGSTVDIKLMTKYG